MSKSIPGIGDKWLEVCRLLNEAGVDYLVVGGVAMGLHGTVRATKDIDVLVPRDLANTTKLLTALEGLPFGLARELDPKVVHAKVMTIIGDDPKVDVLHAAGSLNYVEAEPSKKTKLVAGVDVPYVALRELIRSKQTDRLEDVPDRRKLERLLAGPLRRPSVLEQK